MMIIEPSSKLFEKQALAVAVDVWSERSYFGPCMVG
jgi:hypothetical protein